MAAERPKNVPPTSVPPRTPRPAPPAIVDSPRIQRLRDDGPDAVARFWAEVAHAGTPLIERDRDATLITFVWRERRPTRDVLALVNKLADRSDLSRSRMRRLPGSDLWHLTYRVRDDWMGSYHFAPDESEHEPLELGPAHWREVATNLVADPLNPVTLRQSRPPHKSVAAGPAATPSPRWWQRRSGVPEGTVDAVEAGGRQVWRYLPPGYRGHAEAYPVMVLLDGDIWGPLLPVAPVLDNLIAAGRIPPLVALLPESGDQPTRFTEYACDPAFTEYLATGLIAEAGHDLNLTSDPSRTVIAGQSLGGLAAAFAGFSHPERFGNVLSQSGAFWWKSSTPDDVDAEWFAHQVALAGRRPVRWHVEVGLDEWVNLRPNRHLRDVLTARGYELTYSEFAGGHDRLCWRERFGEALSTLLPG
ncbi:enterochelin esterase [Actinoplanes sp. CA-015351]|uniref:enterochelin esterase n=1 Tax=Actinoplanes sp. CA-015351 TaxID=3239897 RepID=UPI003D994DCE